MPTLPPAMLRLLAPFAPHVSRRVWPHALVLVAGTILAPGRRTVTAARRAMGRAQDRRCARYQRVLKRGLRASPPPSRRRNAAAVVRSGDPAIQRTRPARLGRFALVARLAQPRMATPDHGRQAAWSPTACATVAAALAVVRRQLWAHTF